MSTSPFDDKPTEPTEGHARAMQSVDLSSCPLFSSQDFKLSRCVVQEVEKLNRGVHAGGTIRRFVLEFKAS